MQSDRVRPAQLPFWPGLQKTARIAKAARAASAAKGSTAKGSTAKGSTNAKGARSSSAKPLRGPETPAERAVRLRLQERMSARVGLKNKQGRGSFTVHFTSYAELEEIMRRIDA